MDGRAKRPRQHQPAAFAAGEPADRRARLLRPEQKILHVADDMLALAVDLDEIAAAAGERVLQDGLRIEAGAALIERRHRNIGAEPDIAGIGRETRRSEY